VGELMLAYVAWANRYYRKDAGILSTVDGPRDAISAFLVTPPPNPC
jgi:hypothetical protein